MFRFSASQMLVLCAAFAVALLSAAPAAPAAEPRQISADVYLDKVRGMWMGELIGNYAGRGKVPGTTEYREGHIVRGGADFDIGWDDVLATTTWVSDDDTCFEYLYLDLLGQTATPTSADIRQAWLDNVPASSVYIANRQARYLMDPPPTGASLSPPDTGKFRNNVRAYAIDSQITTEALGALVPGLRQRAADLSGTFAAVSNEGYSAHAAQFYAAMYAAAGTESDVPTVIEQALAVVPVSSRSCEVIQAVRSFHQADGNDWRACQTMLYDNYGTKAGSKGRYYGWIESTVNLGMTTMALLYGEGDFRQTVDIGVLAGYDADCNPATAAGLLGMIKGYAGADGNSGGILAELPGAPTDAYDVRCLTSVGEVTTVSQVVQDFAAAAEMQIVAAGGKVVGVGSEKVYVLPDDVVAPPPELPDPDGPAGLVGRVIAAGGQVDVSASVSKNNPAIDRDNIALIIDGITDLRYNGHLAYWTRDGEIPQPAGGDWYQLTFPRDMTFNKIVFHEGDLAAAPINGNPRVDPPLGGLFEDITVEVFRDGAWCEVGGLSLSEALDANAHYQTIEMTFDAVATSLIRVRGTAGGLQEFTSIVELEAHGAMGVAGDCDEDSLLEHADLTTFAANYGGPGQWSAGDFNFDGQIDASDYVAMKRSWRESARGGLVPEPTSLLLWLVGAAMLRPGRRRKPRDLRLT